MEKNPVLLMCRRLCLLLWKNMILRKRHWVITCFQVFLPVVLVLGYVLSIVLGQGGGQGSRRMGVLDSNSRALSAPMTEMEIAAIELNFTRVAYVPSNAFTDKLIQNVAESIRALNLGSIVIDWKAFNTESEVETAAKDQFLEDAEHRNVPSDDISAAIVFKQTFNHVGNHPPKGVYSYTLRFVRDSARTDELFTADKSPSSGYHTYKDIGFVGLQLLLDQALIKEIAPIEINSTLYFETMRTYQPPRVFLVVPITVCHILAWSFIFIVPSVVREVVSERESGIKELMKIMGLPNWMHLLGWIIDSIIFLTITISLVTFLLFFGSQPAVITDVSAFHVWIVIFVYCMASVAMCIFIASFFEQPAIATTLGFLIWVLSYVLANVIVQMSDKLNIWLVTFLGLIPNVGLYLCLSTIHEFESIANRLIVMAASFFFYLLITLYVENIMPFTYGVRKPWYYIFTICCVRRHKIGNLEGQKEKPAEYFQTDPTEIESGVEVLSLSKEFSGGKKAVDNLSLNIFKGQITALLGHNGAGKTTTMSILTGIVSPTHGTAIIDGHDIRTDMEGARQSMGLCPQHNMLFDRLTVKEHLMFFAKLKGTKSSEAKAEMNDILNQLDMRKKMNDKSQSLSGGQKRKLNLAMALIGGSRVVILDEPTSGMDPESRRSMWDLLMSARAGRTILFTTHLMEEADVLGDRIAIMAEGKLKCCGTSTFLKNKYGAGYIIKMTLKNTEYTDKILSTIRKHVNDASFKGMPNLLELAVALPSLENGAVFPALFSDLESNKEKLGINTVSLSLTTMDEIFMKVILMEKNSESLSEVPSQGETHSQLVEESNSNAFSSKNNAKTRKSSRSSSKKSKATASKTGKLRSALSKSGTTRTTPSKSGTSVATPFNPDTKLVTRTKPKAKQMKSFKPATKRTKTSEPGFPQAADVQEDREIDSSREIPGHERAKRVGLSLLSLHFYAILMKRVHYTRRKLKIVLFQLIILLAVVILTILLSNFNKQVSDVFDQPLFDFTLSSYSDPKTPYRENNSTLNIGPSYAAVVGQSALKIKTFSEVEEDLVNQKSYIVGADFNFRNSVLGDAWAAYYSDFPHHALPLSTNLISNALLHLLTRNMSGGFSIEASTHPLQSRYWTFQTAISLAVPVKGLELSYVILLGIGLAIVPAFLVIFPAEERITKAKHLQLMTGVSVPIFWGTSLLWDFLVLFAIICVLLCCFPILQANNFYTANNALGVLFVILLVYAFSSICLAYAVSLFVKTIINGFSLIACVNILFGLMGFLVFNIAQEGLVPMVSQIISRIMCQICPLFGILRSLQTFFLITVENTRCGMLHNEFPNLQCNATIQGSTCCVCPNGTPWKLVQMRVCFQVWPFMQWWEDVHGKRVAGITQELFYVFIAGIFYFLVVLSVDCGCLKPLFALCHYPRPVTVTDDLDEDVIEEANRIQSQLSAGHLSDAVTLSSVTKMFGSFPAVNNLTFGAPSGECFGLLGVNGAGKTTTFKILTGDTGPSHGNVFMGQYNIRKNSKYILSRIGYCPQFDAILGVLSGKEMLQLFSRLRGSFNPSEETTKWLSKVGLLENANVSCKNYSGGMKRRLSTAMALIGDPPLVMLDEPTSGVDPVARRQFWGVIRSNSDLGQAIILTSHSMDEIDALCSRLAIMVDGQFQCFGGVQHIKSKFGKGFILVFKLKPTVRQESPKLLSLMKEVEEKFQPCDLKDRHENLLQYQVYKTDLPWKNLFEILENLKSNYAKEIEEYSATETTLDEIFVSFARRQYMSK